MAWRGGLGRNIVVIDARTDPSEGQYPPPGAPYPPPSGQYHPPQGYYPPPGGQYPPQGSQYSHQTYPSPVNHYPPQTPHGAYPPPAQAPPGYNSYPPQDPYSPPINYLPQNPPQYGYSSNTPGSDQSQGGYNQQPGYPPPGPHPPPPQGGHQPPTAPGYATQDPGAPPASYPPPGQNQPQAPYPPPGQNPPQAPYPPPGQNPPQAPYPPPGQNPPQAPYLPPGQNPPQAPFPPPGQNLPQASYPPPGQTQPQAPYPPPAQNPPPQAPYPPAGQNTQQQNPLQEQNIPPAGLPPPAGLTPLRGLFPPAAPNPQQGPGPNPPVGFNPVPPNPTAFLPPGSIPDQIYPGGANGSAAPELRSYYYVRSSASTSLVFDVEGGNSKPSPAGSHVILVDRKYQDNDGQMWYDDQMTGTIRNKLSNYCLTVDGSGPGSRVTLADYTGEPNQAFIFESADQQFAPPPSYSGSASCPGSTTNVREFYLVNELNGSVLHVRKGSTKPGASIGLHTKKTPRSLGQIWYLDDQSFVRSKIFNHAISINSKSKDKEIETAVFNGEAPQQWLIDGNKIFNKLTNECLTAKKSVVRVKDDADVIAANYEGKQTQHWKIEYI